MVIFNSYVKLPEGNLLLNWGYRHTCTPFFHTFPLFSMGIPKGLRGQFQGPVGGDSYRPMGCNKRYAYWCSWGWSLESCQRFHGLKIGTLWSDPWFQQNLTLEPSFRLINYQPTNPDTSISDSPDYLSNFFRWGPFRSWNSVRSIETPRSVGFNYSLPLSSSSPNPGYNVLFFFGFDLGYFRISGSSIFQHW